MFREQHKDLIAIIDYGMGNLFNVQRACDCVGLRSVITSDRRVIEQAGAMILPGVGAFGDAINNLRKLALDGVIREHIARQKPFFGICLGMQLLMDESEEFGGHKGLGVIRGRVIRFKNDQAGKNRIKVPQVGWNRVFSSSGDGLQGLAAPFESIASGTFMYFVHSFYVVPESRNVVGAVTCYEDIEYCSLLVSGPVVAVQFHPEKSGRDGLRMLRSWAESIHGNRERVK